MSQNNDISVAGQPSVGPVTTRIYLVAAVAKNGVIGAGGNLPWHLPEDMRHFKKLTLGHPVIMGRKTCESIVAARGGPLPGRVNIVVTRTPGYSAAGCVLAGSLAAALAAAGAAEEAFVIGGGELYREALPIADRLELTEIDADFEGDAWFPEIATGDWHVLSREPHSPDAEFAHPYAFVVCERIRGKGGEQ